MHQVVHRSALQKCLVGGAARSERVTLHLGYTVEDYDFEATKFCVKARDKADEPAKWVEADVILAADGVKSKARTKMLARVGEVDSGQLARAPDTRMRRLISSALSGRHWSGCVQNPGQARRHRGRPRACSVLRKPALISLDRREAPYHSESGVYVKRRLHPDVCFRSL